MASVTPSAARPTDRDALRRILLERIVKSEALRRDQRKTSQK